jgi:hypothetical protein
MIPDNMINVLIRRVENDAPTLLDVAVVTYTAQPLTVSVTVNYININSSFYQGHIIAMIDRLQKNREY